MASAFSSYGGAGQRQLPFASAGSLATASSSNNHNPPAQTEQANTLPTLRRWFLQLECKLQLPNGEYRPLNWPFHLSTAMHLMKEQRVRLDPVTGVVYAGSKLSSSGKKRTERPCGWLNFSLLDYLRGILQIRDLPLYLETTVSSYHYSHYSHTQIGRVAVQVFAKVPHVDATLTQLGQQRFDVHARNLANVRDKFDKKKKVKGVKKAGKCAGKRAPTLS